MKIKYFVPLIILSGFYSSSFAALTWSDDLEASLQKAKEEDKSVIALFHKSGNSDSQHFHQDVLNQDDFLAESRQQLLFTEVDTHPLHKNVTQEYQHKMNLLQLQYKISGDTLLFLHPHNITLVAYRIPFNAKSYKQEPIEEFVKEGLERKKLADNLLAQAQKAQGSQKAAILLKGTLQN